MQQNVSLDNDTDDSEELAIKPEPVQEYILTIVITLQSYLQSRGFNLTVPPAKFDLLNEHFWRLTEAIIVNAPEAYCSDKAVLSAYVDKQTTYEKCDLAFSALLALKKLFPSIYSVAQLNAFTKMYLELDKQIEQNKALRNSSRLQSSGNENSYTSAENRENYLRCLSRVANVGGKFNPYEHPNRYRSTSFINMFSVLCQYEPFMKLANDILVQFGKLIQQPHYENNPGLFKKTVYFDNFRAQFGLEVFKLLELHRYQSPEFYRIILTNLFLLERYCDRYYETVHEVNSFGFCFGYDNSKDEYIIKTYDIDSTPISLTQWLLSKDHHDSDKDPRQWNNIRPRNFRPTKLESFAYAQLKAIAKFERQQIAKIGALIHPG